MTASQTSNRRTFLRHLWWCRKDYRFVVILHLKTHITVLRTSIFLYHWPQLCSIDFGCDDDWILIYINQSIFGANPRVCSVCFRCFTPVFFIIFDPNCLRTLAFATYNTTRTVILILGWELMNSAAVALLS